jgi:hypothetical protein
MVQALVIFGSGNEGKTTFLDGLGPYTAINVNGMVARVYPTNDPNREIDVFEINGYRPLNELLLSLGNMGYKNISTLRFGWDYEDSDVAYIVKELNNTSKGYMWRLRIPGQEDVVGNSKEIWSVVGGVGVSPPTTHFR